MLDFHEKRKLKSWFYSKPMVAGLLIVAVLLSVSVYGRFKVEREMAAKRDQLAGELEVLRQHAATLEAEVGRLKSERGIEEEIRDRFEVSKRGEQVVLIVGEEDVASTTTVEPIEEEKKSFFDFHW